MKTDRTLAVHETVKHRFVDVNGLRMHVAEAGAGEPVVLVHTVFQHWCAWRHVVPTLAERFRVVCPDLRGCGRTDAPARGYEKETLADDGVGLLDALALDRVHVAGHSLGGLIGFLVALRHPERVDRLLAVSIPPSLGARRLAPGTGPPQLVSVAGRLPSTRTGDTQRVPALARWVLRGTSPRPDVWTQEALDVFTAPLADVARARAISQIYRTLLLRELVPILRGRYRGVRLSTPTVVLLGTDDYFFPISALEGYEPYADDLRLEIVPGAGHFLPEENPRPGWRTQPGKEAPMSGNRTTSDGSAIRCLPPCRNMRGVAAAVVAAVLWATATPTSAESGPKTVTWGADQCREAALLAETDYANVAPLVPPPFDDDVLKAGAAGAETASLIFTFNRCTDTKVSTGQGTFTTGAATEIIAGVVLSPNEYSTEPTQFYTLANYVDWEPLATAFKSLGLPTVHIPGLSLRFEVNALTGLGSIALNLPAPGEQVTANGSMAALNPPPVDAHAASLGVGPRGVVAVHHHSPVFGVNPGAAATITTDRADGIWAKAMGATSRRVNGTFFEKGSGHEHSATLVG